MEVGPFIPVLLSLHTNVSFLLLNRNNAEMKRKWGKRNRARLGFPVFGDQRLKGKTTQNDDDLTLHSLKNILQMCASINM